MQTGKQQENSPDLIEMAMADALRHMQSDDDLNEDNIDDDSTDDEA